MGVAYVPDPSLVILTDIDASTSASLRAGLHTALLAADWTVASTLTDGYIYQIESPQAEAEDILLAKVRIEDTGRNAGGVHYIDVQFMDLDEEKAGMVHLLRYEADHVLRAHVCPSQLFTWKAGSALKGTAVMGGIPWVPPMTLGASDACSTDTPSGTLTERAWWSMGDTEGGTGPWPTLRTDYRPDSIRNWSCRWNTFFRNAELGTSDPEGPAGVYGPRLFPVANTYYYYDNADGRRSLGQMCWYGSDGSGDDNNLPLFLDPLIGWSINASDHYPYVIGQVWDALLVSTERSDAQEIEFDDVPFFNYTRPNALADVDASWFSSLFLRVPEEPGTGGSGEISNIAY